MNKIDLRMSIGDSVTRYPNLSGIYMSYGVDFCCGGHRSIGQALNDSKVDANTIIQAIEDKLDELEKSGETTTKLNELSNEALIDNIVNKHHSYLREVLPGLGASLFKLMEVHGHNHPELFEIHHLVGMLRVDLEAHLIKEEKQLFPLIAEGNSEAISDLIEKLEGEHDGAGDILKQLTEITDHFKLPEDACTTYILTYRQLQELQEDMYQHVHKENNVLFKRFV